MFKMNLKIICVVCLVVIARRIGAFETCEVLPTTTPCRPELKLCERICKEDKCEIRAVVILPNDTNQVVASLPVVLEVLKEARDYIYEEGILPGWLQITLIPEDDKCIESYAQIATFESFSREECIHVMFGPICEYAVATVSRIMRFYGTPLISPGGFSLDFEQPKLNCSHDYFMMIRSGSLFFNGLSQMFKSLVVSYGWRKVLFLYDKEGQSEIAGVNTCSLLMQTTAILLGDVNDMQYTDGDMGLSTLNTSEFLKQKIGVENAIIVMCVSQPKLREILLEVESLGNMAYSGEYIFFNYELINRAADPERPWIDDTDSEENNKRLEKAYKAVMTLTRRVEDLGTSASNKTYSPTSNFMRDFYDSILLYAHALRTFLNGTSRDSNRDTTVNGYELIRRIYGKSFPGYSDDILINCNGDRRNKYTLMTYNNDENIFEPIATYEENDRNITMMKGKRIHWPGGLDSAPPDTPTCGYDNSKCPDTSLPIYVYISIALAALAIVLMITSFFMYRRYKLEAEIASMTWKVAWEEIIDLQNSATRRDSLSSSLKRGSQVTFNFDMLSVGGEKQVFMPIGFYRNNKVAIKKIAPVKTDFSRAQLLRLKQMKDLQHEHLVKFHGACLDPPNFCILTEYCPKGSLQDILENDQFTLEWMIRISLIQDLVRGMSYLHQSEIKTHGSLSSTNCVVDSRFVLKVTDFGLPFFKKHELPTSDSYAFWRRQLWTAPELLRFPEPSQGGTQKGDVYSFGIIVHEVVVRQGLFYLGDGVDMSPNDIINVVKYYTSTIDKEPLRPYINDSIVEEEIATLMRKCWSEDITERPDFTAIKNIIKKLNKEHDSGNILDNLLSRMEQYANNLESLVDERTADYLEEKRKCEELLYQLLPKSVAAQLIAGQPVEAEAFDQVTIYFSDIVGFTALSASSTPLQVVDLLNDLYTVFDSITGHFDVYKVETIGDAYMVVSGLPERNGDLHAREIARMSLSLLEAVRHFTIRHRPDLKLQLRIGIHTGPCVAGIVGHKMPRYCLFGDTVNTASRMESNGEPLKIHVSPTTKAALEMFGSFELELRGDVQMKGKGVVRTYWLKGERKTAANDNLKTDQISVNNSAHQDVNEVKVKRAHMELGLDERRDSDRVRFPVTPKPSRSEDEEGPTRRRHKRGSKDRSDSICSNHVKYDLPETNAKNVVPLLTFTSIK